MKLFIDTANVEDIRRANDLGVICGVTIFIAGSKATVIFFGIIVVIAPAVRRVQVHGERETVFLSDRGNGSGIDGFAKVIEMLRLLTCDPIHDTELLFIRQFEETAKTRVESSEGDFLVSTQLCDVPFCYSGRFKRNHDTRGILTFTGEFVIVKPVDTEV